MDSEIQEKTKLAILGWGSLLWDQRPEFDQCHQDWQYDGPVLKLEFSRISWSRGGALTLVIDPDDGSPISVAYCISARSSLADAISDLRHREGTSNKRIGWLDIGKGRVVGRHPETCQTILAWASAKQINNVIWTDLKSNFKSELDIKFSVPNAIAHLQGLPPEDKVRAAEYIWRAPSFIKTELRTALEVEPWFAKHEPAEPAVPGD